MADLPAEIRTPRILPDLSALTAAEAILSSLAAARATTGTARRGRQTAFSPEDVRACHARGLTIEETMAELGCSRATVARRRAEAGIVKTRRRYAAAEQRPARHQERPVIETAARMPAMTNPAFADHRSLYPSRVAPVEGLRTLLVAGENSWKVGGRIVKGKWKGFPVFTLTLEERATCPVSCAHWRSCYGNHMHLASRIAHGPALEERLGHELAVLQSRYPNGFAVRLHVLGDFYSTAYVEVWRSFLDRFPALHVFGFSARWQRSDPIALALLKLVLARWDRFAIRFSNAPADECSTVSIEHPLQRPSDAVICPAQLGRTANCGTCGLCWGTTRRIAFIRH